MAKSGRPAKIDPIKPIHRAIMDDDISRFSVEVASGADLNTPGPEDMTPLHLAADRGNVEIATVLLNAKVDVNPLNHYGATPIWFAVKSLRRCPDGAMIRLLLAHGADPTAGDGRSSALGRATLLAGFPPELLRLLEEHSIRTQG